MKALLIQVDGTWPNLALMKISRACKLLGYTVALIQMHGPTLGLIPFEPDWVYVSCVFSENKGYAHRLKEIFSKNHKVQGVQIGGPGTGTRTTLPDHMEHLMPDYDLYGIHYSIGFTSRGCFRKCPWCLVPKLEGRIRDHAPITEFWHPDHKQLILLDNNFLASPKWRDNLAFIHDHALLVNFSQGLDIRLINDDNAELLSTVRFRSPSFKSRYLYFAFDTPDIEDQVRRGVAILGHHGVKPFRLMFYMLCGYNTTHEEDLYRFNVLRELGCDMYIMRYNNRHDDPWLNHFTRWVNSRIYKSCALEDYDHGNSQDIVGPHV